MKKYKKNLVFICAVPWLSVVKLPQNLTELHSGFSAPNRKEPKENTKAAEKSPLLPLSHRAALAHGPREMALSGKRLVHRLHSNLCLLCAHLVSSAVKKFVKKQDLACFIRQHLKICVKF